MSTDPRPTNVYLVHWHSGRDIQVPVGVFDSYTTAVSTAAVKANQVSTGYVNVYQGVLNQLFDTDVCATLVTQFMASGNRGNK